MHGWFKLHRELIEKPLWIESTPEQKTVLITLLSLASHKQKEWEWRGEKFKIKPGQFITSLESIAEKSGKGISIQNVRTSLKRFEKYGFLTNQSTNKNRLITIVNWGIYQSEDDKANKQSNKQLTSNQQATNNYQELKKEKNEKKRYYDHVFLTDKEYSRFLNDFGKEVVDLKIEELDNYIGSTGKQYKDHNKTLRIWLKKDMVKKVSTQQLDHRDMEIALQQWISDGGDPEEFVWN